MEPDAMSNSAIVIYRDLSGGLDPTAIRDSAISRAQPAPTKASCYSSSQMAHWPVMLSMQLWHGSFYSVIVTSLLLASPPLYRKHGRGRWPGALVLSGSGLHQNLRNQSC